MISKQSFVNTITKLETLENKMDNVDAALKELSPDFGGFYLPDVLDITVELLAEMFNDTEEWLSYFLFEKDWLHSFELGDIIIEEEHIEIKNWEDVYDFMIGRYNIG